RGRHLVAAAARHERLDLLLDAVLPQAGRALVQVVADQFPAVVAALQIQVQVDLGEHLATVGLVRITAAHGGHTSCACWDGARVRPRSAAYRSSWRRRLRRPRCNRDMTVPIGVPMMSAISL